ncbi:hypothetical protein Tco_0944519, partial [Tanacetum coccineum]
MNPITAQQVALDNALEHQLPRKQGNLKKPTSPSKKKTLVTIEEPAKKPTARRQSAGVQIRDTPGVFVSKKKAPVKTERSKGIELLSEAALLEEAQLKKAIKQSKQETNIHQAGGSSKGAGIESEVPDEQKGKSIDTSEGTGLKPGVPNVNDEQTVSDNPRTSDDEDEFVHTPEDYVPTNDENVDDEEYDRINKELYDDVNVGLKDAEPADEGKGNEEMTDAEKATVTAALATQKTKVPLQSSSISSDYATKFLNFDNIPSAYTKIISMMDIKVQHEDLSSQTSPFLTIPVLVIPESLRAPATTIPPPMPPFIPLQQQSTPIPTPTTIEATISTITAPNSTTLTAIHQRLSDLENEAKTLKNVDHSSTLLATIKSKVLTA